AQGQRICLQDPEGGRAGRPALMSNFSLDVSSGHHLLAARMMSLDLSSSCPPLAVGMTLDGQCR
ncbi:MAG: hypothetical protein ACRC16_27230, partial [Aeromonas salmonicida]